jgi:hypothetical protein
MQRTSQKEQITPNKSQSNKQYFDSETNESSKKDINLSQTSSNEKQYKKSIEFFPKKIYIEELNESEEVQRKYTIENKLEIKDFVPKLKPIEIHLIPSKLRLNKKGIKDYKRNKNNKILLNSKKYFISCPNSEDEESENYSSSKEIIKELCIKDDLNDSDINLTRRNLQKTKNKNMPKVHSKNEVVSKGKYENELNLDNSSDSDLYDIDEIDNYCLLEYDGKEENKKEKKENEEENNNYRDRANSVSILEILRKKSKLDNE